MKARHIATAGFLVAIQLLTLALAYIIPTIKLALLFASSLYAGVLMRAGFKKSVLFASFLAAAGLCVILIQIIEIQAGFAVFFGWYPLLHEKTKNFAPIKRQLLRWLGFAASAAAVYLIFTLLFPIETEYALWVYALGGAAAFAVMQFLYEFCVRGFVEKSKICIDGGKITFK